MATALASFNTSIDSISLGLKSLMFTSVGIPSITYSGLLLALIDRFPRIRIVGLEPGAPLAFTISTPASRPWAFERKFADGVSAISLLEIDEIAPVKSRF